MGETQVGMGGTTAPRPEGRRKNSGGGNHSHCKSASSSPSALPFLLTVIMHARLMQRGAVGAVGLGWARAHRYQYRHEATEQVEDRVGKYPDIPLGHRRQRVEHFGHNSRSPHPREPRAVVGGGVGVDGVEER